MIGHLPPLKIYIASEFADREATYFELLIQNKSNL